MSEEQPQAADASAIGRRLRELRLARGLLQQDLATTEISTSYVSLIEGGKRRPSPSVLEALAERLGSSVEYLRTGRDEVELTNLRLEVGFAEMALRNGSQQEALQSFNHVLTRSVVLGPELLLRARIGQASALEKLDHLEAALSILHEIAEDPSVVPGSTQWAEVTVALCRCYRRTGDFSMSVDIGERAMRRLDALALDVTDDHIMLGVDLAGSYAQRGDYTRGQLLIDRLLSQAEETGSRTARGMVYWNASLIAESRGQRPEAIALVERALGLMAEGDNPRHLARLKILCAGMLMRSENGDVDRAHTLFEQAREALTDLGGNYDHGDSVSGLALVALRRGRPEEAVELAQQALEIFGDQVSDLTAETLVFLGEAQLLSGRTAAGETTLQTAFHQLRQLPRSRWTTKLHRDLGDVWHRQGYTDEALLAYQHGLTSAGADPMPAPARSTRTVASRSTK
ncbi:MULTISPECIES: tetratricopeptide repeat protein [Streptacidiphilus]|uniref:Tetratricopeptide repeat protein n=1 Tax=Streptacidiphilus cavernicola TaxID=3342716 RepID=A0ABV6UK27_9ACTN|nr:tetratricopeptide repeat protein [Streptacidiphilus jeojiense]